LAAQQTLLPGGIITMKNKQVVAQQLKTVLDGWMETTRSSPRQSGNLVSNAD
jgi:hypothetical protein